MKISPVTNHGKIRWRVNIQQGTYRKRLFFESREQAAAFAAATGGPVTFSPQPPPRPSAPQAPAPAPANFTPRQAQAKAPGKSFLESWLTGEDWGE